MRGEKRAGDLRLVKQISRQGGQGWPAKFVRRQTVLRAGIVAQQVQGVLESISFILKAADTQVDALHSMLALGTTNRHALDLLSTMSSDSPVGSVVGRWGRLFYTSTRRCSTCSLRPWFTCPRVGKQPDGGV